MGNIFFPEKMPMFVVLDASRRMVNNFSQLHENRVELRVSKNHEFSVADDDVSISIDESRVGGVAHPVSMTWTLPFRLGTGDIDFHHPYFIVKKGSNACPFRKNYFETVVGEAIHFSEVQAGDVLELYPNYYDFEFLDVSTRRYELTAGKNHRRAGALRLSTRPYFMEELLYCKSSAWTRLWKTLKDHGTTDTQLRNIEALLLSRFSDWCVGADQQSGEGRQLWKRFVQATLRNNYNTDVACLEEYILSGVFFDFLELKTRVLKARLSDHEGESQ
jgi:hypothetical protein